MALVKLQVLTEQGSYFSSTGEFTMVDNGFGVTRGRGVCPAELSMASPAGWDL